MGERDYSHRDLCSATSGMLEAMHNISKKRDQIDTDTVEIIVEHFEGLHEDHGAETPLPDISE